MHDLRKMREGGTSAGTVRVLQQEGVRPLREVIQENEQDKKNRHMQGLLV
jgi:hypothetical protein